jgi:anti-anti-sigma factor
MAASEIFEVRSQTHGRTVLIELFGELDIATVSLVADAFENVALDRDGLQHIVLDLRGLTFMDATGIHELLHRSNEAHQNRHDLTVIRGRASINNLMVLTGVDTHLVLVESPEELIPPISLALRGSASRKVVGATGRVSASSKAREALSPTSNVARARPLGAGVTHLSSRQAHGSEQLAMRLVARAGRWAQWTIESGSARAASDPIFTYRAFTYRAREWHDRQ